MRNILFAALVLSIAGNMYFLAEKLRVQESATKEDDSVSTSPRSLSEPVAPVLTFNGEFFGDLTTGSYCSAGVCVDKEGIPYIWTNTMPFEIPWAEVFNPRGYVELASTIGLDNVHLTVWDETGTTTVVDGIDLATKDRKTFVGTVDTDLYGRYILQFSVYPQAGGDMTYYFPMASMMGP